MIAIESVSKNAATVTTEVLCRRGRGDEFWVGLGGSGGQKPEIEDPPGLGGTGAGTVPRVSRAGLSPLSGVPEMMDEPCLAIRLPAELMIGRLLEPEKPPGGWAEADADGASSSMNISL